MTHDHTETPGGLLMKALLHRPSGFADRTMAPVSVTIVGFVYGEYEPGYQRSGIKKCTLAIIADDAGYLSTAELPHLKIERGL